MRPLRFEAISLVDLIKSHAASHHYSSTALSSAGSTIQGSGRKRLVRLASEVIPGQDASLIVRCQRSNERTNERTSERTKERMNEHMRKCANRQTDRQTDRPTERLTHPSIHPAIQQFI